MAIYVDELRKYGARGWWCHMMTDDWFSGELYSFAWKIGLKTDWLQHHPQHPHFDLRPSKRREAIANGAVEISSEEMLKRCSPKRRVGNA